MKPDEPSILKERIGKEGNRILKITLNSEKTLNALSLEMIRSLHGTVCEADNDPEIKAVLIFGSGDKAFCAGGDIKQGYFAMCEGKAEEAENFFRYEYPMDYALHKFSKPLICFAKGIVMGGGVGVMQGCRFRIVSETTRFAMPEALIGLYPDVGAGFFLNRIHPGFGKFIGYTSVHLNAGDLLYLGLADRFVRENDFEKLSDALADLSWKKDLGENIGLVFNLIRDFSKNCVQDIPKGNLQEHKKEILGAMDHHDLRDVLSALGRIPGTTPFTEKIRPNLEYASPTSLRIFERMMEVSKKASLLEVLKNEFHLSVQCVRKKEYQEGVRALLIDRDRKPSWKYPNVQSVPETWIDEFFTASGLATPVFGEVPEKF